MSEYLKSLAPLAVALVLVVIDKLVVNDAIPDAVWLTLFGTAPAVWVIPNTKKTRK